MLQSVKEQDQIAASVALTVRHKVELVGHQRFAIFEIMRWNEKIGLQC